MSQTQNQTEGDQPQEWQDIRENDTCGKHLYVHVFIFDICNNIFCKICDYNNVYTLVFDIVILKIHLRALG